ncbi:hypothetical protein GDO86_003084 [Hymenochirus boettgeri]|uniref:Uncharacterized protein n=1 Tax=Hymenochirus boettgeri TaxID=247094 RepID=A0A8T2JZU9_9PIPI|nr:hypothetical protein GDO86_003084 [Hymenochirus boettgeri]
MPSGRIGGSVVIPPGVCLSTHSHDPSGPQKDQTGKDTNDIHCSQVAKKVLVLGSAKDVSGKSVASTSTTGPTLSRAFIPSGSQASQFDVVAVESAVLKKRGIPLSVIPTMLAARKPSSSKVYHRIWQSKEDQFETGFRPLLDLTNDAQWSTTFTPDKLREVQALKDDDWERSSSSFTSSETSLKRKIITVPGHNEITSSLSSSKHLLQKRKRTMETSRCDTPNSLIKMREDQVETAHLTPTEKKTMTTDEQTVEGTPSPNEPPRKRKGNLPWKRHVHLICPERPDEFYKLPPGPIPGYSVTQADYDAAKEAVRQRFLKLFEPSAQSAPSSALESSSLQTSLTSQALIVSGSSLLHTQGVSETQKTDTSGQNIPVSSYNFNSSFSDAKPSVVSSTTTPIFSTNATVTSTLPPSLASVQQKSESPKSSLLQILSKSEENTQSTVFKPIFEPRQSTNNPPNTSGLSSTTTATFMPIFGNSSIPETQSNTFKPILKDPCSQTVSSPFVFKSTNSTVSTLSLLSDKVNSTHANNPSKPNVIFSATTSNNTMTTSSGFAPIFGVDSQTKTVSSVGQDSTLKANTRFGVLNSTSTASVTNASLQQASTFRTATFATTSNPPTISNNTTGISGTSIQANIPTTTSFPNFGIQMGKNVFSAQNPFGNNQSKVATSVQSAAKTTSSFGITTSANLQSTAGNSGSALNTAIPFNSGPQSNNPTDSNLFNCVAQTGIGTPNKSTSFIFGNQKKVEDKNQPAFGQSTNTVPFQPMTPTQNFSSSTTAFTPIATAPGQSSAATSFLSMTPVQGFSVSSTTFTSTQQAVGPSPTSGQFPSVFPTPFNSAAASFSQNSNFFSHGIQPKPKPTARHKLHTRRPHQRKK